MHLKTKPTTNSGSVLSTDNRYKAWGKSRYRQRDAADEVHLHRAVQQRGNRKPGRSKGQRDAADEVHYTGQYGNVAEFRLMIWASDTARSLAPTLPALRFDIHHRFKRVGWNIGEAGDVARPGHAAVDQDRIHAARQPGDNIGIHAVAHHHRFFGVGLQVV